MKKKCLIGIFLLILLMPNIAYLFVKDNLDLESIENRTLSSWPEFSLAGLEHYPGDIETYINDHAAFKPQIMALYTTVNRRLFDGTKSSTVISGMDNWLFYADGHALEDYRRIDSFNEEQLRWIADVISEINILCKEQGIEFVFFIAPNKASVYGQYMPDYYFTVNEKNRAEELIEYLQLNTDIEVIFPREALIERSLDYLLYYKSDTHWNHLGGFIGTQELIKHFTGEAFRIDDLGYSQHEKTEGDLGKLLNLPARFYDDYEFLLEDESYAPAEKEKPVMMFLGDSFSYSMLLVLENYYQNLHAYLYEGFELNAVKEMQPDIFVLELVERNLDDIFEHLETVRTALYY